jgi:hypothetical protein
MFVIGFISWFCQTPALGMALEQLLTHSDLSRRFSARLNPIPVVGTSRNSTRYSSLLSSVFWPRQRILQSHNRVLAILEFLALAKQPKYSLLSRWNAGLIQDN